MFCYGAFVERNTRQRVLVIIGQGITTVIPQLPAPIGVREIKLGGPRCWPHLLQMPEWQET